MKKLTHVLVLSSLAALAGVAAEPEGNQQPAATKPQPGPAPKEVAIIKTSKGEMVIELWADVAPKTVANFKKLAAQGFYDGTIFHRIIKGFMIQGGDPLTKDPAAQDRYGTGGPGYKIDAEFNSRPHVRGVISMARNGDPLEASGQPPRPQYANSAGSQFFICLDEAPHLNGKYTAFGKLIKGEEVLMRIGDSPTKSNRWGENSVPTERITIDSIKIVASDKAP
ncbi:MAG: peptidylprolyl isomerase [Verrucomicrobiota bacterium]|nr:peptidylprolyl isomerase [Verrucomicrobiota bacterium]